LKYVKEFKLFSVVVQIDHPDNTRAFTLLLPISRIASSSD